MKKMTDEERIDRLERQVDVKKDRFNFELIQKAIGTETYLFGRIVRGNEDE